MTASLPQQSYYTLAQAGQILGVSRATLYRWIESGKLRAYRASPRTTRINRLDLEALLTRRPAHQHERAYAMLDAVYATAPVGLAFLDQELRFIRVNARLAEMNGLPVEEHLGRTPRELLPDIVEIDEVMQTWRRILRTGEPILGVELSGQTPAAPGQVRYRRENWYPVPLDGEIIGIGVVVEEVTERKRAEEATRILAEAGAALSSSLDYQSTIRAAARFALPHLADWCIVDLVQEDGAVRRLAVEHADPAKAHLARELEQFHPEPSSRVFQVISTGEPELVPVMPEGFDDERANEPRHGRIINQLGVRSCMVVPLVSPSAVVGALSFIAGRAQRAYDQMDLQLALELGRRVALAVDNARLYQAAAAAEERFRAALDGGRLGAWSWNPSTDRIAADRRMLELFGLDSSTFSGEAAEIFRRIHPDDRPRVSKALRQAEQPGNQYSAEFRVLLPGDRVRWLAGAGRARFDPDGQVTQVYGVNFDITERKALEQMQRDFIANVSHELRNPLSAIKGYAQFMGRRGRYDERAIGAIISQAGQIERLIEDLLDSSRLEARRLELRPDRIDLVARVLAVAELAQATTERHRVRIEAPDHPVLAWCDPNRIGQVLQNLLSNAIKYSPDGGEILVRVEARGLEARVSIHDRGLGLAPEAMSKLFERFYRSEMTSAKSEGLGLGLYISKELVEAHGGQIWAESDGPGTGSTFRFTLPLDQSNARLEGPDERVRC